MKKTLIAGTVMALLSHGAMAANDWRFAAGADLWNAQGSGQVSSVGADGSYDENYNWSGYLQLEHGRADLRDVEQQLQQRVGEAVGEQVLEPGQRGGVVPREVEAVEPALGEVDVLRVMVVV